MTNNPVFIKSETTRVPNSFNDENEDGMWLTMLEVQGVSHRHLLFMHQENPGEYFYLVEPQSGMREWLKKWVVTRQKVVRWEATKEREDNYFPSSENIIATWRAASAYVLEAATNEVAEEMGVK